MNTYGFANQFLQGYRMADGFTLSDPGGWVVERLTFFGYQTGTYDDPPVSPITGVYYQIWDGPPNDPGSSVVFGDLDTNRMIDTGWSSARGTTVRTTTSDRPVRVSATSAPPC
jgi:hypothetical protein